MAEFGKHAASETDPRSGILWKRSGNQTDDRSRTDDRLDVHCWVGIKIFEYMIILDRD